MLRQDPATGDWVIVAPRRGHRPHEPGTPPAEERAQSCPLCPGHEEETPPELFRLPSGRGTPWAVRVVPNKFAVLSPADTGPEPREAGWLREAPGVGHHELVVDSPHHARRMSRMGTDEIARVLDVYHARYGALRRDDRMAGIVIFKNSGPRAGASLTHPHSQIVATPMAPPGLARRYDRARAYFEETDRCLYRDLIEAERDAGVRIVLEAAGFVVFCPFASGMPYETWIAPTAEQPSFGATSRRERRELAAALGSTLFALDRALGAPDFNYVLHTAPIADERRPYYRWHLQILPRVTTLAGLELGAGIPVNITFPEEAAAALRAAWPGGAAAAPVVGRS